MIYFNLLLAMFILILLEVFIFISWPRLSKLFHGNYTFFDLLFISLYPIEEIFFLALYYLEPSLREFWVSSIVIIICLTLAIDKWLLKKQNDSATIMHDNSLRKTISEYEEIVKEIVDKLKFRECEKGKLLDYIKPFRKKVAELKKEIRELKKNKP